MFHASLKPIPDDLKGKFTQFPHPNHPSLASLFRRCYELYEIDPTRAPTIFFIEEGDHEAGGDLVINYPMKIIGAGRDKTTIHGGGFMIRGRATEDDHYAEFDHYAELEVEVSGMTVDGRRSCGDGLHGDKGLTFLCTSMTFTKCNNGVVACDTNGRLVNCVITQCTGRGILAGYNAVIQLEGSETKVDGNMTLEESDYGLEICDTSAILLLWPLAKENVSTNHYKNGTDRNYNSYHFIQTVMFFGGDDANELNRVRCERRDQRNARYAAMGLCRHAK